MAINIYFGSNKNSVLSSYYYYSGISVEKRNGEITMANSSNKLLVPGIEQALDQIKYEIAQEFGVTLGSDTTSRSNGSVGGEITKRLIQQAQAQLKSK
jgi:hypothetical protein